VEKREYQDLMWVQPSSGDFPQQFDKGDKTLVAVSPKMREFFKKARLLTRSKIDISTLNYQDLSEFRILLQEEIDQIAAALNRARADAAEGRYADPHWYRAAETAKKTRGRWMLEIQMQLRKAKHNNSHATRLCNGQDGLTQSDWDGFYNIMRWLRKKAQEESGR